MIVHLPYCFRSRLGYGKPIALSWIIQASVVSTGISNQSEGRAGIRQTSIPVIIVSIISWKCQFAHEGHIIAFIVWVTSWHVHNSGRCMRRIHSLNIYNRDLINILMCWRIAWESGIVCWFWLFFNRIAGHFSRFVWICRGRFYIKRLFNIWNETKSIIAFR